MSKQERELLYKTVIRNSSGIASLAQKLKAEDTAEPPKGEVFLSQEPALNPNTIDPNRPLIAQSQSIMKSEADSALQKQVKAHDGKLGRIEARITYLEDGIQQIIGLLAGGTVPGRERDPAGPAQEGSRPHDEKAGDEAEDTNGVGGHRGKDPGQDYHQPTLFD